MKTIFTTLAFIVLLSGCATTKKCTCTSAWITYCNKYNINPHKATLEQENYPGEYLESNWYNNQIYEPILFRDELDNIEVSIVNLNDKQGNPLTQQLIIIA